MSHNHRRRPSLLWPLLLIGVGVILLLSNLGVLPQNAFSILWRFWPLMLVMIGLDILLGRRSTAGSIIVSLLALLLMGGIICFMLLSRNGPSVLESVDTVSRQDAPVRAPLLDYETATITIDWASAPASLYALSDSNQLIDGRISYIGQLIFDIESNGSHADINLDTRASGFIFPANSSDRAGRWEIGLHPDVQYDLVLDASSGSADYDLSQLQINSLIIDASSGPLTIALPETGKIEAVIDGGSGLIIIRLPNSLEAQIALDKGSGAFIPSQRFSRNNAGADNRDGDEIWVTESFQQAENYVILKIDQGSGAVRVE